ncbi:hypothetical protein V1514DRAFT_322601 [Lipomyces japonicus]|uniref:uncharacterized protein n=1 Tax=Lipomyces japonicus TaxID=56871 RepID=UPI0034CF1E63
MQALFRSVARTTATRAPTIRQVSPVIRRAAYSTGKRTGAAPQKVEIEYYLLSALLAAPGVYIFATHVGK